MNNSSVVTIFFHLWVFLQSLLPRMTLLSLNVVLAPARQLDLPLRCLGAWMRFGSDIESSPKLPRFSDRTREGTALGIDLVGGTSLIPERSRLRDITSSIISLLSDPKSSPKEFGRFFGVLQWLLLVNRPILVCCGAVYGFLDSDDDIVRAIPRKVRKDLALISCMLCSLVVDLNAE